MKKICFILIAILFSVAALAQSRAAYGLRVENQTNCPQNYYVVGDELCNCGGAYASTLIVIPPGGTHVYPNSTTIPGFPTSTPKGIFGAKILDGPVSCNTPGGSVGQGPCGLPPTYIFMSILPNCRECARTRATWVPSSNCDQMARLVFTP